MPKKLKSRSTQKLKVEGWIDIQQASARENLNNGKRYFIFLDGQKACYNCKEQDLYGAVLVLGHISRFWMVGEVNFSSGWYVNVKDLMLLNSEGILESIKTHCPDGDIFED